jgi:hypothetical protein
VTPQIQWTLEREHSQDFREDSKFALKNLGNVQGPTVDHTKAEISSYKMSLTNFIVVIIILTSTELNCLVESL